MAKSSRNTLPRDRITVFDLALDYAQSKRIAIAASDQASPRALEAATGLFQALGNFNKRLNGVLTPANRNSL